MQIKKILTLILVLNIKILFSQNDSVDNVLKPFPLEEDLIYPKRYKAIDKKTVYFEGNEGVKIEKHKKGFVRIKLYENEEIKCRTFMVVGLKTRVLLNDFPQEKDSVPLVEEHYEIELIESGKHYEYYTDGKIKIEGFFLYGNKKGKWKYYDENGIIYKKEWWKINKDIPVRTRELR